MPAIADLQVQLVGWTEFQAPADLDWQSEATGGQALSEFAGRACYQAWQRTNPATASNAGYLRHVLQVGHLAVLEHASATFYLTGLSRALAAELTRHRHFSFSQLSPRYQAESAVVVEPELIAADPELHAAFVAAMQAAEQAHQAMLDGLTDRWADGAGAALARKQLRQAARALQPGAAETKLVMTGNLRAWRHFIAMRGSDHADREMRQVAISCLQQLHKVAGNVFADFTITQLADGSAVAASPLAGDL